MAETKYRTTPDHNETGLPKGVPFIIGNEAAERFSYYGMRAILTVFMAQHLILASGEPDRMSEEGAKGVFHLFAAASYTTPIIGAIIADVLWGKYKTILIISMMYCLGHGMLALMDLGPHLGAWDQRPFLYAGLALIAIGAGGIKPCVSAHVGDQFGRGNKRLMTQVFNWFYFSINAGAVASQLLTPYLLANVGPWAAFGLPGVLMAIATLVFWMGRKSFIHVPPAGWRKFKDETFSPQGVRAILNLTPLFLIFVPMFWAIFDQSGSEWVLQADRMNRDFLGLHWLPSQIQAVNPFLILIGIPIFTYGVYPLMGRFFKVTPLRKIGIGLGMTGFAFAISGLIETGIEAGAHAAAAGIWADLGNQGAAPALIDAIRAARDGGMTEQAIQGHLSAMPNVGWQFLAYIVLTSSEIMVSIVCLEFAYTQSPPKMKSFVMGIYFLGVSLGNIFVSIVNFGLDFFKDDSGKTLLEGANYYWFFTGLMFLTWMAYMVWSRFYKGHTYIQGEDEAESIEAEADVEGTRDL